MTSHAAAAAVVRTWGEIQESNLRQAAAACLSLSSAAAAPPAKVSTPATTGTATEATPSGVGTALEGTTSAGNNNFGTPVDVDLHKIQAPQMGEVTQTAETPQSSYSSRRLESYLSRLDDNPDAILEVVHQIASDTEFVPEAGAQRDQLETALLEYVRPLPAKDSEANFRGYIALARIAPEKAAYASKVEHYRAVIQGPVAADKQRQKSIIKKLVKKTAEFDGSAWYRHPSSPRYQDIRPFVTLYIRESGSGRRYLELFVNYTSRTDWLFVESAQINVDGKIVRLPASEWLRDNDTEIWEWTRYVNNAEMIKLARKIAESDRAVIRFNGQKYYSDHVISATEKSVISDMLLAWEGMKD
jgi:hypothetical protein